MYIQQAVWFQKFKKMMYLSLDFILNTSRFSENLTNLFFLLARHKFTSIALATVLNFNEDKRKKKKLKMRKAACIEYLITTKDLECAKKYIQMEF